MIESATHTEAFTACHRLAAATLPARRLRALLKHVAHTGEPLESIFSLPARTLLEPPLVLTEKQIARLAEAATPRYGAKLLDSAAQLGVRVLLCTDAAFPKNLEPFEDAPPLLFVRGDLQPDDEDSVAIVGSRRTTGYGRAQSAQFAAAFAASGLTVISGGAAGIDTSAHTAALQTEVGRTIAVIGCGLDIAYPAENKPLFQQIVEEGRGAILSEYPLGMTPDAWHFPARNRIIAALARALVVIETPEGSGALITAQNSLEYGRDVWVVPGPVDTGRSRGGHRLIQDGANLADTPDDVLRALGKPVGDDAQPILPLSKSTTSAAAATYTESDADTTLSGAPRPPRPRRSLVTSKIVSAPTPSFAAPPTPATPPSSPIVPANLSPDEAALLAVLHPKDARHLDEVSAVAGFSAPQAAVAATLLTIKGLIRQMPGNLYVRA